MFSQSTTGWDSVGYDFRTQQRAYISRTIDYIAVIPNYIEPPSIIYLSKGSCQNKRII